MDVLIFSQKNGREMKGRKKPKMGMMAEEKAKDEVLK
jgi:hypothetical protein